MSEQNEYAQILAKRVHEARAQKAEAEAAERDRDYLTHAAEEIARLAPEPGEETSLAEQRATMQAGAKAGEALQGLDELLGGLTATGEYEQTTAPTGGRPAVRYRRRPRLEAL